MVTITKSAAPCSTAPGAARPRHRRAAPGPGLDQSRTMARIEKTDHGKKNPRE